MDKCIVSYFTFYTGPSFVDQIADKVRDVPGAFDILAGTERVYFGLRWWPTDWGMIDLEEHLAPYVGFKPDLGDFRAEIMLRS